jgi:endonuclease III
MKELIDVRSNTYYSQEAGEKEFELKPMMELVLLHTNGKDYSFNKKDGHILSTAKIDEIRLIVNLEQLQDLITGLQLHQKKLQQIQKNATQLTSLVRHITSDENEVK